MGEPKANCLVRFWRRIGTSTRSLLLCLLIFFLIGMFLPGFQPARTSDYEPPPTWISRTCDVLFWPADVLLKPQTPFALEIFLRVTSVLLCGAVAWALGLSAVLALRWCFRKELSHK